MGKQNDSVMTIDELSVYLKVAKSTLYKLAGIGGFIQKLLIDGWAKMDSSQINKYKNLRSDMAIIYCSCGGLIYGVKEITILWFFVEEPRRTSWLYGYYNFFLKSC